MRHPHILLSFAIADLFFSTFLSNGQQYFSFFAALGLVVLGAISGLLFVLSAMYLKQERMPGKRAELMLYALIGASIVLILWEYAFALSQFSPFLFLFTALAAACGIYLISRLCEGTDLPRTFLISVAGVVAIAVFAYFLLISTGAGTGATDELAYNYYASQLLLGGHNPYLTSMKPALSLYYPAAPNTRLDGSAETAYIYPAFSFISLAPIALASASNSVSLLYWAIILIYLCSMLLAYRMGGTNKAMLLPLSVWLFFALLRISVVVEYLGVSVLLLLAYSLRKKAMLSGALAGLAASTTQFAWFAIPFLLILKIIKRFNLQLYRQLAAVLVAFLVVNGYFLLSSPGAFVSNLVGTFSELPPTGSTLFQLLLIAYPVSYAFSTALLVLTFLLLLFLFYLYPNSLRPLLGIVPALIFLLSWRNLSVYGLPFVPLILAIAYGAETSKPDEMSSYKKVAFAAIAVLILGSLVALAYAHGVYSETSSLRIDNAAIAHYTANGTTAYAIVIGTYNGKNEAANVSFYVFTRNPASVVSVPAYKGNASIAASSSRTFYIVPYPIQSPTASTGIFVLAFDNTSVASYEKGS